MCPTILVVFRLWIQFQWYWINETWLPPTPGTIQLPHIVSNQHNFMHLKTILIVRHKWTGKYYSSDSSPWSDATSSSSSSLDVRLNVLLHDSPAPQAQKTEHATRRPVHPQLLPLQAFCDSHPQRMSLSTLSGARGTSPSIVRGNRVLFALSVSHPNSTGLSLGGYDSKAPSQCATW